MKWEDLKVLKVLSLKLNLLISFGLILVIVSSSTYASSETKSYADLQAELDQLKAVYTELEKISDAEETSCGGKLTTADMITCATKELQQWWILMASLRDHVSDIAENSDEEGDDIFKENFAKSQKAWEEFVVSDCKFKASKYHGGSLAGVEHAFCHVDANKLRAKELLVVLDNP